MHQVLILLVLVFFDLIYVLVDVIDHSLSMDELVLVKQLNVRNNQDVNISI